MPKRIELPDRWPLYSPLTTRAGTVPLTKDARLVNGYVEYDPADKQYWIYKRLGLQANTLYPFSGNYGIYQSPSLASFSNLFTVTGSTLRRGTTVVSNFIDNPALSGMTYPFAYLFETVTSNPITIFMMTPFSQFVIDTNSNNVTKVNNNIPATQTINQPNLVPGAVYLDGTLYVMDPKGNIWGSNLNDATTWNPLNVIAASATSDQGVALAKQLNYVIAFKQTTTQVFYNNQNPAPGSPLSPVPDSQIPLGCYAPYSVKEIDNSLFWLSSNNSVSPQLVQMDNLIPKIVSTPSIERILDNTLVSTAFGGGGVIGWVLKHAGHRFYGLYIGNLNLSLIYDIDQQAWYVWTDFAGNAFPVVGTSYQGAVTSGIQGPHLAANFTPVGLFNIDSADVYPNDNGVLFPVDIYTANFDAGVDKTKVLNLLRFTCDQTKGSILKARYNDNDYDPAKWSNFRTIDLSQTRPFIDQEGEFYRRAYHLRHICNTPLRIKSGELLLGLGVL